MKNLNTKIAAGLLMGALVVVANVPQAQAAPTANTVVTLAMVDNASITATAAITVTPTLTEIVAGEVTTAGNPITLTVDSTNGSEITLSGSGGTLDDGDLALSSDNGTTWVTADDAGATTFYTSSATQSGATIPVKVRISNLGSYEVGNYTNTITFTIAAVD